MRFSIKKLAVFMAAIAMLSACGGKTATHYDLDHSDYYSRQSYQGSYKVGKPYTVEGVTYYPKEDPTYQEIGMASWYGPKFHGKGTANGDRFDQNALTAAHKTLPLPCMVRVTNLENGRTLMVMVNDRGPFSRGRIIDVSRRAAQLLGFEQQGIAKVKVEYLGGHTDKLLTQLGLRRNETASVDAAQHPSGASKIYASNDTYRTKEPVSNSGIYIQAGTFGEKENAMKAQTALSNFEQTHIVPLSDKDHTMYRVLVGPFASRQQADSMVQRINNAGHRGMIVVSR